MSSFPLTRVPWWDALLFGVILACVIVCAPAPPHVRAGASRPLTRLLCWVVLQMGVLTIMLALPLWDPNSCSTYVMYPLFMIVIYHTATPAGSQKSPIAVSRKVRLLVSFAHALLGVFVFAFILRIPCAWSKVDGATLEVEGISVPLRKDVCIYPYVSILVAILLWLPDCIVQGRRGALRKARLREVISRPTRPGHTSSPAPSQNLSTNVQDPAAQTHAQNRGCAKGCFLFKAQLRKQLTEKLVMLAIALGLYYPLGLWDALAVIQLLTNGRLCYAMLRDQVWDDASSPLVETLQAPLGPGVPLEPVPPQLGAGDLTDLAGAQPATPCSGTVHTHVPMGTVHHVGVHTNSCDAP